jgi:hypothetical protein
MNKHEPVKQLNLKDNETYELATKFARKRGESLNGAVKTALKEALEREERELSKEEKYEQIVALARSYSARVGPRTMTDEEAIGYDENGLPK